MPSCLLSVCVLVLDHTAGVNLGQLLGADGVSHTCSAVTLRETRGKMRTERRKKEQGKKGEGKTP